MLSYLLRRLLYTVPILFGVMLVTFFLFHVVIPPEEMARQNIGAKASEQAVANWLRQYGFRDEAGRPYPLFFDTAPGKPLAQRLTQTLFARSLWRFAKFDLGKSYATGEPVSAMLRRGAKPSLCITLPAFALGLFLALGFSLMMVFVRDSRLDRWGVVLCVAGMSIPIMSYVIGGQKLAANYFPYFPAFGFNDEGFDMVRFIMLPVAVMVISALGTDVRLYRTIFLEEIRADYIRTAQAKGASHSRVLLVHMLKNGLISIITLVVAALPFLIMGTMVIESFFGIPGLGRLMITAIQTADFGVVQADVYLGSLLYLLGLLLTDICYALADPRIRLQ